MKTSLLLLLIIFSLSACIKDLPFGPKKPKPKPPVTTTTKADTIPDKASFRIELFKDSTDHEETMIMFNHLSSPGYLVNEDAAYASGFGKVNLSSLSDDGKDLSINSLPYKPGMSIGLDVIARVDGAFSLLISYENKIPADIQIMVKDMYLKDSLDVRSGSYNFNVSTADSNSFGNKRFQLILKKVAPQTTGAP